MSKGLVGSGGTCNECERKHYARGLCKLHYLRWWFHEKCEARKPVKRVIHCKICGSPIEVNAKRTYRAQFLCDKRECKLARAREKWPEYKLRKGDDIRANHRIWRRNKRGTPPDRIRGPYRRKTLEAEPDFHLVLDSTTGYYVEK